MERINRELLREVLKEVLCIENKHKKINPQKVLIKTIKVSYQKTIHNVITSIIKRECIICNKDLDKDLRREWHIPLCHKHRLEFMKEGKILWKE